MPGRTGIGLRAAHQHEFLEVRPDVGWLEVHSENYFAAGGRALALLERTREHYPLSLHGVGLSLGSTDPLDDNHLRRLGALVARFEPVQVSEHLSWSSVGGRFLNDLLPLPYTEEVLEHLCGRIGAVQDFLNRRILIENISAYSAFDHSVIPECEFLAELSRRTGCGILLDVNNLYVSAANLGIDPHAYLRAIPASAVGEIHLAGHERSGRYLIDSHSRPVSEAVWALYREALGFTGPVATLVEWDKDLPALAVLVAEARKADRFLRGKHALAA